MKQYLNILQEIRETGDWKENRTGIRTLMVDGASARYDQREGFSAVTTKKLAWQGVRGELCGFLRGFTNAADFRDFGCMVWDQNANENKTWLSNVFRKGEDDLGVVYGSQWRKWKGYKHLDGAELGHPLRTQIFDHSIDNGWNLLVAQDQHEILAKDIDQIRECITKIIKDPDNRRNLFHAWNPAVLDEMALPPCHLLYQFLPNKETKEMSLCMYQRSCDMFLGVPFNIASSSLLLAIVCHLTGYTPKNFIHFMADAHIYENHLDRVDTQLTREPYPLPTLKIDDEFHSYEKIVARLIECASPGADISDDMVINSIMEEIDNIRPEFFTLLDYQFHPALKATVAV